MPTSLIQIIYSQKMDGVNIDDQNRSYYNTQIATKKMVASCVFFLPVFFDCKHFYHSQRAVEEVSGEALDTQGLCRDPNNTLQYQYSLKDSLYFVSNITWVTNYLTLYMPSIHSISPYFQTILLSPSHRDY